MSFPFDPQQGLIIVPAELWGPTGSVILRLALDTGATSTVVNVGLLVAVGYDPALIPERIQSASRALPAAESSLFLGSPQINLRFWGRNNPAFLC